MKNIMQSYNIYASTYNEINSSYKRMFETFFQFNDEDIDSLKNIIDYHLGDLSLKKLFQ